MEKEIVNHGFYASFPPVRSVTADVTLRTMQRSDKNKSIKLSLLSLLYYFMVFCVQLWTWRCNHVLLTLK